MKKYISTALWLLRQKKKAVMRLHQAFTCKKLKIFTLVPHTALLGMAGQPAPAQQSRKQPAQRFFIAKRHPLNASLPAGLLFIT